MPGDDLPNSSECGVLLHFCDGPESASAFPGRTGKGTLAAMVQKGWIAELPDPEDDNSVLYGITPAGEAAREHCY